MATKNLIAVKKELEKRRIAYYRLRDMVEIMENIQVLPALKKQYQGKYFKYRNSSGSDSQWWLYSRCTKVLDKNSIIADSFESTPYGCEFKVGERTGFSLLQQEITKTEYKKALASFLATAQKLLK